MTFIYAEIKTIDTKPTDWISSSAWPGAGLYQPKDEQGYMYLVGKYIVYQIYGWEVALTFTEKDLDNQSIINDDLLIRAIAAAAKGVTK